MNESFDNVAPKTADKIFDETICGDFALSLHYYHFDRQRNHLDLFLSMAGEEMLSHFFLPLIEIPSIGDSHDNVKKSFENCFSHVLYWQKGRPHRRRYLYYSGVVENDRGRVRVLLRGQYRFDRAAFEQIDAQGAKGKAAFLLQRESGTTNSLGLGKAQTQGI